MLRPFVCAITLAGVMLAAAPVPAAPLQVICTFSILGDMVRNVGEDHVAVTTLVGPDGDTHMFEPKPLDLKSLAEADLVVANGLGFEPWLGRMLSHSDRRAVVSVVSQGITPMVMGDGLPDPHVWQDLANGRHMIANIAAALGTADPAHAAAFQANAQAYSRRLQTLEAWVREKLDAVPAAKRRIITSHDAFGYFGKAYGVELLSLQGLSTDAEPTARDVARLVRQIRSENVRAVFLESMASPRLAAQLAKDAGAVVGGVLYTDALSPSSGPAPTYEQAFRHNVTALTRAMNGK